MSEKLPRWVKAMIHADLTILVRVAQPVASWVDWRFHVNRYDQAAMLISLGLAMNAADNMFGFLRNWRSWLGLIILLNCALLIWVYSDWLKRLQRCSRQWEKDPVHITRDQAFFMHIILPPLRLFMVVFGLLLSLTLLRILLIDLKPVEIARLLLQPWLSVMGAGLYVAGTFPPHRPRREKKTTPATDRAMAGATV